MGSFNSWQILARAGFETAGPKVFDSTSFARQNREYGVSRKMCLHEMPMHR
jgi:hypothetical protein